MAAGACSRHSLAAGARSRDSLAAVACAMFRISNSILTRLLLSSAASPIFSLHRLLSTAAATVPPNPSFAVEEYLVDTCGLTGAQALKASRKLSHLKSSSKPDAVLAFLSGLSLSGADIAALVAKDPLFLCTGVEKILGSNVVGLTGLGLSLSEIACLALLSPLSFRCRSVVSNLQYCMSLFGSYENLFLVLRRNSNLLKRNLEKVVKPNVAFLRECGLGACHITKLCMPHSWLLTASMEGLQAMVACDGHALLTTNPEKVQAMVACAEGLGVPRGSVMFKHALQAAMFLGQEKIAAKVEHLQKTFRWSDTEVGIAVSKFPVILRRSKHTLQSRSEFLICEVGLEPVYIARRPALLSYSLEGRLKPRYYVVKFPKENGLLDSDPTYYFTVMVTEKVFMKNYISPHIEAAPYLAEDYATACRGEVPARFLFA